MFIFAQFILGCASGTFIDRRKNYWLIIKKIFHHILLNKLKVTFYTVGFSFVEDSAPAGKGAILFGLIRMASAIGPVFGYIGRRRTLKHFHKLVSRWCASVNAMGGFRCDEWRRCDYWTRWPGLDWCMVGWNHFLLRVCFRYIDSFLWLSKIYSWNCQGSVFHSTTLFAILKYQVRKRPKGQSRKTRWINRCCWRCWKPNLLVKLKNLAQKQRKVSLLNILIL